MSAVAAPAKLASASPASSVTVRLARRPAMATSPPIETSAPSDAGERHRERGRAGQSVGDDEGRADRGRLRRAEQGRLGQRIAQQALQRGAREDRTSPPIRIASRVRGRRISRTTIAGRAVAAEQACQRLARRQRRRPDHQRDDGEHDDERGKRQVEAQVVRFGARHRSSGAFPTGFRLALQRNCGIIAA